MAKYQKWTPERINKLVEMYPSSSWEDLITTFQVSKHTLEAMAHKLGVKRIGTRFGKFTATEDQLIIQQSQLGRTADEIASLLPSRTPDAIATRRLRLGISKSRAWTEDENARFKELYPNFPIDDILEAFPNRTRDGLIDHARVLGIRAYMDYYDYSPEELSYIRDHFETMSDAEIGEALGRSRDSVKNHRNQMGCHRVDQNRSNYDDVNTYIRRHNLQWKTESIKNCGYQCIITGGRFQDIHHLVSQNLIVAETYARLGINPLHFNINALSSAEKENFMTTFWEEQAKYPLGVCLNKKVHHEFHTLYGFGNNTPEQFEEFRANYAPK